MRFLVELSKLTRCAECVRTYQRRQKSNVIRFNLIYIVEQEFGCWAIKKLCYRILPVGFEQVFRSEL